MQYNKELTLHDYMRIIAKRKRFIITFVLLSTVLILIAIYTRPKTYKATAILSITSSNMGLIQSGERFLLPNMAQLIETHKTLLQAPAMAEKVVAALRENYPHLPVNAGTLMKQMNVRHDIIKPISSNEKLRLEINTHDPALSRIAVDTWAREYIHYVERLYTTAMAARGISKLGKDYTKSEDTIEELSWSIKGKEMFINDLGGKQSIARNETQNRLTYAIANNDLNVLQWREKYYLEKQKEILAEMSALQDILRKAKDVIREILAGESPEAAVDSDIPTLLEFIDDNGIFMKAFSLNGVTIIAPAQKSQQSNMPSKTITILSLSFFSFILAIFLATFMETRRFGSRA